jgi:nicotinamidase/pyrazinamidase
LAGSRGAEFLPGLHTDKLHTLWRKGYQRDFEAYAVTAQHPGFSRFLRASGLSAVAVCGIATNICCFFTARDLRRDGFRVVIVEDASAGIDIPAAGLFQEKAKREGQEAGIEYVALAQVLAARR